MGAKVQQYSGVPYVKRSAIATNTEEVVFPNPTQMKTTPSMTPPSGPGTGVCVSLLIRAQGADVQVCFDGEFSTNYLTITAGAVPVWMQVRAQRVFLKGTAAGSIYELVAELAHS